MGSSTVEVPAAATTVYNHHSHGGLLGMLLLSQPGGDDNSNNNSFTNPNNNTKGEAALNQYLIDHKDLTVGECIGEGSSGVVYRGVLYGDRHVAVKALKGAPLSKGSLAHCQLRREVLSLICCAHRNVLKLYGVCLHPELGVCIVTKFMEGGSLLRHLQRRRSLSLHEILRLATDVARGMEFLHKRGVVHMDLKTANVFLDEEGNAVIGDLGVARLVNENFVGGAAGEDLGSYRWMAPEVCRAAVEDRCANGGSGGGATPPAPAFSFKSDVYSYGILVWELVTCAVPYGDHSPLQAAVGVVVSGLRPQIPTSVFAPLRYLIQKCWDQDPAVRPTFSAILNMLHIISVQHQDWV